MPTARKEEGSDVHPSLLAEESLLNQCEMRRERRSGPGGQHRNKVETAVVITHEPTGVSAEANERRSQAENRRVAIFRLRLTLATQHHSARLSQENSDLWKLRCSNGRVSVATEHADFPAILAEAMCGIRAAEFDVARAAKEKGISTSQMIRLLKKYPAAWASVNAERQQRNLHRLK